MISSSRCCCCFFITCCWFSSFNAFIYSKPRWHVSCGCSNNSSFDECRKINENVTLNSFNCLFRAHIKREQSEKNSFNEFMSPNLDWLCAMNCSQCKRWWRDEKKWEMMYEQDVLHHLSGLTFQLHYVVTFVIIDSRKTPTKIAWNAKGSNGWNNP